ncbi:glycosyl transferase, group 1 [Thermoanaerobacter sp. X514]|nr:glycosyl transferase, group 1 [Thermoanaerobacter sp. X514]
MSRILPFHSIGGMQAIAWDLARQFVRDGIRVTFLTTKIPNKPEKFVEDGIEVVTLKNTIPGRYSFTWWKYSREYFEKNLIDSATGILSVSSAANSLLTLKKHLKEVPFLLQAHGTSLGEILSKWRTLQPKAMISSVYNMVWLFKDLSMYNKYDYVVAVGERVYLDLTKPPISFFLPREKVQLINNGIDTKLFSSNKSTNEEILQELGLGSENIIIISSSRLHKQKGIDLSIKGFEKYAKKNPLARYLIIGDGPELPSLKKLVKTLGISDKVFFLGAIDRERLPNYLQLGDVFLFTTKHSEVGLTLNVLEAMAMGLPAIVSNHLTSVIKINTNNIIGVNPYDSEKIADLLAHVIDNREKYKNSLPYEYTLEYCAKQYYKLFGIVSSL